MATVQKAMAQHEQRSLHTFFVKHGSRPAKDCPQPERLPTVQPKTPPASETTDSNPSGGHSSDWLTVDDDLSRRKRRKTTPPEYTEEIRRAPGSSSAVAVAVIIDPECPPPVSNTLPPSPSDWPEERPGNARYSLRKAATNLGAPKYVFENPLKDEISKNKRKVLQLNPNGKLLDLPVKGDGAGPQETSKEAKQRDRPRKRPKLKSERPSKIAIIRYGSEKPSRREHLGQEIYEIINGLTTYNLLKKRAEKLQLSQGPPKPTHPFFLAKQFPNKIEDAETQKGPHAQEGINAPKDQQRPLNPLALNPFAKAAGEPRAVSAPKLFTKPKRADDPVEPIWPPCGMIHVQGSESELNRVRCEHATFDLKKAKGSEAKVPGAENILATILRSIRKDCPRLQTSMELPLRNPRRMLKPGHDLQGIISEKLNQNPAQRAEEALGRSVVNSISSKSVHPAIANLLSSIATSRSSFEKGGYEELTWAQKYAPDTALKVLQAGPEAQVLRSWLQKLTVTAVNTTISKPESKSSKVPKAEASKRKKRKRAKDLDDFIVSSDDEEPEMGELPHEDDDDEDELAGAVTVPKRTVVRPDGLLSGKNTTKENSPVSNTILLSGPPGCGKTAAVYAVASELGFEVFEVNAGSRRSARDVVERVGDMAQNHLVQILNQMDGDAATAADSGPDTTQGTGKQTSMSSFFKQKPTSSTPFESKAAQPATHDGEAQKPKTNQRQSLILLEEVDVLFNEDKQFWSGVLALITQSKRPIVMTCNDESLLPMENLSFHAMLRFRPPPPELVADYLSVLCANEGHIIEPQALLDLYATVGKDLRATIMQLNYWCQMAVGSQKSGLDWIVDRPWLNRLEDSPDVPRIISLDTYIKGMGWLSRDMAMDEDKGVENRTRLVEDFLNQWHVSPVDWVESKVNPTCCKGGNALEQLEQASFMSEMESALDLSCPRLSSDLTKGTLDKSLPPPPDKQRLDYIEGYQFLQTEPLQDYSGLSDKLGVTIGVLLEIMFTQLPPEQYERDIIQDISRRATIPAPPTLHPSFFEKAFSPIIDVSDYSSSTSGYRPLSFEHGASVVSEDVAPYIRSIVAFDLRLEQQRIQLSGLLSQGARRPRTTRASRAAVEGGDKAMIRRERWFPGRIVPSQVKMTGGLDWENILLSHLQRESDEKRVPGATEIPEGSSDCPGKIEYSSTDKNVLSI